MKTNVKTVCPYCGTLNAVVFDETESSCIHSCDIESGGCDNDFAVYLTVKVTAKTAVIVEKSFTDDAIGGHYAIKEV